MRRVIIIIAVAMISLFTGCKRAPEGVVARVNGVDITTSDFTNEYENYKNIYEARIGTEISKVGNGGNIEERTLKKGVLEKLIMRQLLYQKFDSEGHILDRKAFEEYIEKQINELGGKLSFEEFLKNIGISKTFFQKACEDSYKKNVLMKAYSDNLEISEDDIKQKYLENPIKYDSYTIELILTKDYSEALKISKMEDDFKDLAVLYSQDYLTASDGGRIDKYHLGEYEEKFDSALLELEPGEVSKPIEVDNGFYIIKLLSKNIGYMNSVEEIKKEIIEEDYNEIVNNSRRQAEVKIYVDFDE